MNKKIIFDCDNTMGLKGCDVDDGLALLYLLGKKNVEILGITTTYGNSSLNEVFNNTKNMLEEIGRPDIKLFKGCPDRVTPYSEAVDFLIESVNSYKGEISILATGSMTNLFAAYFRDNSFFDKISELIIMGGISENLIINGKELKELNLSCDPIAAKWVLKKGKNISVITGNTCLDAFFTKEEFLSRLQDSNEVSGRYICEKCMYWFEYMMSEFEIDGFYNWDVLAAAFLAEPKLFRHNFISIRPNQQNMEVGLLSDNSNEGSSYIINTPQINDITEINKDIYEAWLNSKIELLNE